MSVKVLEEWAGEERGESCVLGAWCAGRVSEDEGSLPEWAKWEEEDLGRRRVGSRAWGMDCDARCVQK